MPLTVCALLGANKGRGGRTEHSFKERFLICEYKSAGTVDRDECGWPAIGLWDQLAQSRIPSLGAAGSSGATHHEHNAQLLTYKTNTPLDCVQATETICRFSHL